MLSDSQLRIVTSVLVSSGEVFLASLVVPFFTREFSPIAFVLGIMFTAGAWFIALIIGKYIS
ncbi:MAG: hypothetical protein A3J10_02920 [Candidatus Sungbacteria bacterium RIFCSPLOWO2_02_FULL_54_10]|uniref:Uncharacterized protein n=2 Tax=Candidatus Sungiibacteriota TaxID=1817917 RepID=A0A1G2L960_9BACT|nr:MAG: hypothetical protein A2679_00695 [Candidatus Sungbacteria bacterium RIFCSPHIGHO2_01_FULL_54_26]OHA02558.1 MAG: hypothetical protein A3C92_02835 [Candidatus Sungbacteria bacterium RIFCSPHIGHO2_02_FULL_53_17]OHA07352.1 MAG: hypothetical protein A3B34_02765 [Candidatus Sungbacteria bacterium RIFCSPLOWO2_01_FULL_54_21]OHA13509.1 MAG: hypothetical protein A3J10_02920 [Candidatus Sungbacteria bacterium RIFCSPLOWO2_02_FULL_54_10]